MGCEYTVNHACVPSQGYYSVAATIVYVPLIFVQFLVCSARALNQRANLPEFPILTLPVTRELGKLKQQTVGLLVGWHVAKPKNFAYPASCKMLTTLQRCYAFTAVN